MRPRLGRNGVRCARPGATASRWVVLALLAVLLAGCAFQPPSQPPSSSPLPQAETALGTAADPRTGARPGPADQTGQLPPSPREFRAAWVATVANIDWPSRPGLSAAAQRAEAQAILDRAQTLGLNAIVLQVRPSGDAIYPSTLEPWTEFLSGAQGRPPRLAGEPDWDPLAFWLQQAHRRGLELHAWLNPYRARHSTAKSPPVAPHVAVRRTDLVRAYGDFLWMDPGEPDAAAHTLAVVADLLRRYDVDGIHIDDYFYPYPVTVDGVEQPFPDEASWARYRLQGGALAREDWRRANVDALVESLYRSVRALRPTVRVGISPFGLGRPDRRPPGVVGFSQYDQLYADVERWLHEGWLDYLAPQLYWPLGSEGQPFAPLLDTWIAENRLGRHLWSGLFTSRVTRGEPGAVLGPRVWPAREVLQQVDLLRTRPGAGGHIHFSMVALMEDRDGIARALAAGPYAQAALVPATPWLDAQPPPPPRLVWREGGVDIVPGVGEAAARWAVWRQTEAGWRFEVVPGVERRLSGPFKRLVVRAVDRVGNESPSAVLQDEPTAAALTHRTPP